MLASLRSTLRANTALAGRWLSQTTGGHVEEATDASFDAQVLTASRTTPVLVDFYANWCGPCQALKPLLVDIAQANAGKLKVVKINVDDHERTAAKYGIQSLPTVMAFKDGEKVDTFIGLLPKEKIDAFVSRLISN